MSTTNDQIKMFDVDLTVSFLLKFASDILRDFREFAKESPVIYMNDIPLKYNTKLSKPLRDRDYYSVMVSKWCNCTQVERLTILHFTDGHFNIPLVDFSRMVDEMILRIERCKIDHGTMVGVQAAQSLSEKLQQATLNSFHSSGNKKAAQVGLKRLKEVLDASKVPSVVTIGPIVGTDNLNVFIPKTVSDYVLESDVKPTSFTCKMKDTFNFDTLLGINLNQSLKVCLKYNLRKKTLSYSPGKRKTVTKDFVASVHKALMEMHYQGVKNVVDFEDDTLFMASRTTPQTGGKTIGELFNICPDLDLTKLKTNHYVFIQETLGIEAARRYLLDEIITVLAREGISISMRHLNLIVDNMTYTGEVQANRYSALDINDSVILKSTFQQATTTFCNAAANGTHDSMNDVSSQIMMGKAPHIGVMYAHLVKHVQEEPEQKPRMDLDDGYEGCPSPEYAPVECPPSPEYHPSSPCDYIVNAPDSPEWQAPVTPRSEPELMKMDLSL